MNAAADLSLTSISDELDRQLEIPAKKAKEPSPSDLSELDALLKESLIQAKKSTVRKMSEEIVRRLKKAPPIIIVENAAIWEQICCSCGHETTPLFSHYKTHTTQGDADVWKRAEEIDSSKPMRHFVSSRKVECCGECCGLEGVKMEEFNSALNRCD